ncbi:MAG: cytochrome P450 [Acidobacteria bacterium]|nr:MAG: cytochrome P450 [Acidobacteriota bacterium]
MTGGGPADPAGGPHLPGAGLPPGASTETTPGRCPVVVLEDGTWAVRGHAEVLHVATTPEIYSSAARRHRHVPNAMDGEEHRRFRAVVDRHLDDAVIAPLSPMVRRVCDDAAAELLEDGPGARVDALHDLGRQVAVRVQSRWLGWPESLEDELLAWIEDNFAATASGDPLRNAAVAAHFDRIVHEVVQARRDLEARGEPLPDDPTTRLLHDEVEDPDAPGGRRPLTDPELVSMLRNWTSGDLGSIAASVGVVVLRVARDPGLQEELRALAREEERHTEELDAAVDEMLRIDDPFPSNRRVVTRATELAGYPVPEGTPVAINWTAANRDERVFGDPDAYRPRENRAANIVYGAGPHVCPGRLLSTLQIRGALAALLRATTRIAPDPGREPTREAWPSRGWATVPVVLD